MLDLDAAVVELGKMSITGSKRKRRAVQIQVGREKKRRKENPAAPIANQVLEGPSLDHPTTEIERVENNALLGHASDESKRVEQLTSETGRDEKKHLLLDHSSDESERVEHLTSETGRMEEDNALLGHSSN
ncbi:hypothetical protein PR001_g22262 [Phytophthora rubi]|uniref:Uncharacterized protein n=1 Tax=Phytophthora rubi TaxID=129364 RepID=A0A6A3IX14_9STRA|nr:hypothetical protein PR001_g22262 [Phytophthora rubi]